MSSFREEGKDSDSECEYCESGRRLPRRRDKHDRDGVHEKVQKLSESELDILADKIAKGI